MSPCSMWSALGSLWSEWFSRQTTCMPTWIRSMAAARLGGGWCKPPPGPAAAAAAAPSLPPPPAEPDCEEEVPMPELRDRTSMALGSGIKHHHTL